jgi:hypothetical protein
MAVRAEVYLADDDQCVALYGPVFILIARREPTTDLARRTEPALAKLAQRFNGKGGMIAVIKANVRPPSEKGRERIMRSMRACETAVSCGAMVIEGEGFVAAANRGAMTMMLMAVGPSYAIKVFGTVARAATFLCSRLSAEADITPESLGRAIEQLRKEYDAGTLRVSVLP